MSNQPASSGAASDMLDQSAQWAKSIPDRIGRFFTAAHYTLTLLGIVALFVLGMMFFNPASADKIMALSPFSVVQIDNIAANTPALTHLVDVSAPAPASTVAAAPATATAAAPPMTEEERQSLGTPRQQKLITHWLSKRYRVASDATDMLVSAVYLTAREIKLDPLLILAVMAIESRFNPFAESPMGAQGLMQVMSRVHHEKFQELGGVRAALNPVTNIKVGSLILKECVTRGGSVEAGLKNYVGAAYLDNDGGYGLKVLSEYRNLKEVAVGKNIPIFTAAPIRVQAPMHPVAPATQTAVGDMTAATSQKQDVTATEEVAAL